MVIISYGKPPRLHHVSGISRHKTLTPVFLTRARVYGEIVVNATLTNPCVCYSGVVCVFYAFNAIQISTVTGTATKSWFAGTYKL
jgi:hypothetical protein